MNHGVSRRETLVKTFFFMRKNERRTSSKTKTKKKDIDIRAYWEVGGRSQQFGSEKKNREEDI